LLDVFRCDQLSYEALLYAVTANADTLLELRLSGDGEVIDCDRTETLLRAAPRLCELVTDVYCGGAEEAARMLRNEGVFQPLRISDLTVSVHDGDEDEEALLAFAAALAAHARPLTLLSFDGTTINVLELDAVVDAALTNRLSVCYFAACFFGPASVPSLVRLLGGGALTSLHIYNRGRQLLDAPAAALLADALRTHGVLQSLHLVYIDLWRDGFAAATLLSSLVAHPSLRELNMAVNEVAPEHAACVGMALFGLVAANTPALQTLSFFDCSLGDAGLRPLLDALPRNTHLRTLDCSRNGMSEAFARDVLLLAVRANTSLTELNHNMSEIDPVALEAVELVMRRAGARS
jgi:hypothetical protein